MLYIITVTINVLLHVIMFTQNFYVGNEVCRIYTSFTEIIKQIFLTVIISLWGIIFSNSVYITKLMSLTEYISMMVYWESTF